MSARSAGFDRSFVAGTRTPLSIDGCRTATMTDIRPPILNISIPRTDVPKFGRGLTTTILASQLSFQSLAALCTSPPYTTRSCAARTFDSIWSINLHTPHQAHAALQIYGLIITLAFCRLRRDGKNTSGATKVPERLTGVYSMVQLCRRIIVWTTDTGFQIQCALPGFTLSSLAFRKLYTRFVTTPRGTRDRWPWNLTLVATARHNQDQSCPQVIRGGRLCRMEPFVLLAIP